MQRRELPHGWEADLPVFPADKKGIASRDSSGTVLNVLAKNTPWLMGGSADLAPSTKTLLKAKDAGGLSASNVGGRNMHFGVREHAMGAIVNGLSLSKIRPYGSTFLIFSDYMKPAIRLGALMEVPAIYVFTHDSIGVGEDGPTHQPIEQLASLRAIPGLITLRPADANEVVEAWRVIMRLRHEPVALVLTRQPLPTFDRSKVAAASGVARGAYVLAESAPGDPEVLLLATGSEVSLCLDAKEQLERRRRAGASRQHAVVGAVRAPATGVSRSGSAAPSRGARLRRASQHAWLEPLRRSEGHLSRDENLRRIGASSAAAAEVRLHCRARRCRGAASDRKRPWCDRAANRGVAGRGVRPETGDHESTRRRHRRHVDQDPGNGAPQADPDSIGSAPDADADGQQSDGSG